MHLKKLNLNSPLGWVLTNDTKNKTNKNKVDTKKKTKKTPINICSIIHSIVFQSLKTSMNLKNCHLILCHDYSGLESR